MNKQESQMALRGLFSKVDYKRDMYIWFTKVSAKMAVEAVKNASIHLMWNIINPWSNQTGMTSGVVFVANLDTHSVMEPIQNNLGVVGPSSDISKVVLCSPSLTPLSEWWATQVQASLFH